MSKYIVFQYNLTYLTVILLVYQYFKRAPFMHKYSFNYSDIPLWGMESVYRNNQLVGYLRRGEHGYTFKSSIGQA